MTGAKDLQAEARWWRAEYERLGRELELLTAAHAAAIGPVAVRRLQVDHETALQLAREAENRLAMLNPDQAGQYGQDERTLF